MNRPFDAARYAGLLEGLEATEIPFSTVKTEPSGARWDSEFYRRGILHAKKQIEDRPHQVLGVLVPRIQHPVEVERVYTDTGLRVLLAQEVRPNELSLGEGAFMDAAMAGTISVNRLHRDDVVLTRSGANFGQCAPIKSEESLFACADLLVIRKGKIRSGLLSSFLSSRFGRLLLDRGAYGMAQPHIAPSYVKTIPVPRFVSNLEQAIDGVIDLAEIEKQRATSIFAQMQFQLLRSVGLDKWAPPEPLSYVHSSRDAFAAGRLDAAHFAPTASLLEDKIKQAGNWALLGDLLALNLRGSQPVYADTGIPVVNSKHVVNGEVRINDDNRCGICSDDQATMIRPGDVLINGTGVGTIGRAAPYLHDHNALPDNHVTILRTKLNAIDPVYLAVFLNSLAGQLQVRKWLHGSSGQIELYPSDIAQFVVWLAPEAIQQSIRKAIEAAAINRRRAIGLLDAAKRAVEIAIEDSEDAALRYLASFDLSTNTAP